MHYLSMFYIVKLHEIIREQNSDVSYIFEYCDCNLYEFTEFTQILKVFAKLFICTGSLQSLKQEEQSERFVLNSTDLCLKMVRKTFHLIQSCFRV